MSAIRTSSADGTLLANEGMKVLSGYTMDGKRIKTNWQLTDVTKPLVSVGRLTERGHRVFFDDSEPGGGFIMHKAFEVRTPLGKTRGVYGFDVWVESDGSDIEEPAELRKRRFPEAGLDPNPVTPLNPLRVDDFPGPPHLESEVRHGMVGGRDEETVGEEVEGSGRHRAKALRDPRTPSERERREHTLTHLPYRSWCTICVGAKRYALPHPHQDEISDIATVCADYFYMGECEHPGCICSIIIKDARSKAITPLAVPKKGRDRYVEERFVQALSFLGYKKVICRTDQEPALCALIDDVKAHWRGELIHERAPTGDHRANGWVEAGVRTVEAQIKALKLATESRYGIELDHTSILIPWMVDYAGWLVTRYSIGREGKTPYRILKGKDTEVKLCEFAECIQFKPAGITRARGKLQSILMNGVYLGKTHTSGESLVGTADGIYKARDIYRKPADERFNVDTLKTLRGTPWDKSPGVADDDELPEFVVRPREHGANPEEADEIGEQVPRRLKMTKEIVEKHGYTPQCPGCINLRLGRYHRAHLETCRRRIEDALREDAVLRHRVDAASARHDAWVERELKRARGEDLDDPELKRARGEDPEATRHAGDVQMAGDAIVTTPPLTPARSPEIEDAEIFNQSVSDERKDKKRRREELDDRLELELEESDRGGIYIKRDEDPNARSSGDSAPSSGDTMPVESLELIQILSEFGADKNELESRVRELASVTRQMSIMGVDVAEIYSPPRVVALARKYGLRPGFSLDVTVDDDTGKPWDFNDPDQRGKAKKLAISEKLWLLIGSPVCTWLSRLAGFRS